MLGHFQIFLHTSDTKTFHSEVYPLNASDKLTEIEGIIAIAILRGWGRGNLGNARKKTFFFMEVFPNMCWLEGGSGEVVPGPCITGGDGPWKREHASKTDHNTRSSL